jgi:uncharacterized protein DUF5719
VAAGGTKLIDLTSYAPGATDLTVGVVAIQGLVVAAVQNMVGDGADVRGAEWVNPTQRPTTDLLVNATPAGPGARRLVVANTSDDEALVKLQALGPDGAFVPSSLSSLRVKPGTTISREVSDIVHKQPIGWRLTSNVPIVAGATSVTRSDYSAVTAAAQIEEPAIVPLPAGARVSLQVAAEPRQGGSVTVAAHSAKGQELSSRRFAVPGGQVRTWRYRPPADKSSAAPAGYVIVTVEDGSGLHAGAVYTTSNGVAATALRSGRWSVSSLQPVYRSGL